MKLIRLKLSLVDNNINHHWNNQKNGAIKLQADGLTYSLVCHELYRYLHIDNRHDLYSHLSNAFYCLNHVDYDDAFYQKSFYAIINLEDRTIQSIEMEREDYTINGESPKPQPKPEEYKGICNYGIF